MRLFLGALILLALFSAAALWQRSWTSEARSNRPPHPSSPPEGSTEASANGWSRVVLGRPSGGVPHGSSAEDALASDARENLQAAAPDGAHPAAAPGTKIPSKDPPAAELDAEVTVQAGQTLSEICRERYGTASLDLVQAVARYNHLTGPDAIREGQRILLPATEKMREKP